MSRREMRKKLRGLFVDLRLQVVLCCVVQLIYMLVYIYCCV